MNLPNKLTILRILLVPVMVIIPFLRLQGQILGIGIEFWIMNLIFIIASITDKLDRKHCKVKKSSHELWKISRPNSRQNTSPISNVNTS